MPQQVGNVTADGADVGAFQVDPGQIAEFVKCQCAVHAEFIFVNLAKLFFLGIEFVLNIAHQFFQNILKCHHSYCAAEFIDHDGKVCVFVEEQRKQFLQRHHFRYRNQFAPDAQKVRIRIPHQRNQLFDMNQADAVIEVTAAKREASVAGSERFFYIVFETVFDIQKDDLAAGRHDVPDNAPAEIECV